MSSRSIVVLALEKENAIADLRKLMGATIPRTQRKGTIRKKMGAQASSTTGSMARTPTRRPRRHSLARLIEPSRLVGVDACIALCSIAARPFFANRAFHWFAGLGSPHQLAQIGDGVLSFRAPARLIGRGT